MVNALVKSQTSTLHMVISSISKLTKVQSPKVCIHGISWKVKAFKNEENTLPTVCLYCTKKADSTDWSVPVKFTMHLLPFNDDINVRKYHSPPFVFSPSKSAFGIQFIEWDELLKGENKYVQDDTIELKFEIMAEHPNYLDKSVLKFEVIDKSCNYDSHANFRLTVTNVKNLIAVRSPQFILCGLFWDLTVSKCPKSTLGIMLDSNKLPKKVSCKMTMTIKLLSSKDGINSIEKSGVDQMQWPKKPRITEIASWDEMMKPQNGFVNNSSIILEVEIYAAKPQGDVPDRTKHLKRPHLSV